MRGTDHRPGKHIQGTRLYSRSGDHKFGRQVQLPGLKFVVAHKKNMKKKETLWQLLERLDEQAGQFNVYLSEANKYFDIAAKKTSSILQRQEKELHATIAKVQEALKNFRRKDERDATDKSKESKPD
jgi:hypothetical protein